MVVESGPVTAVPVALPEEEQVLDEAYLRSLHIDHLVVLLDKYGVSVPDSVDASNPGSIVDYVVETYGA